MEKKFCISPCTSLSERYLSQTPSSAYLSAFFVGLSKVIVSKHDYMARSDRYFVKELSWFDVLGAYNNIALWLNTISFSGGRGERAIALVQYSSIQECNLIDMIEA